MITKRKKKSGKYTGRTVPLVEERKMEKQYVNEADWKVFRAKLPGWQEAYMDRLNHEYASLLNGDGKASEKFWALEKRISEDRSHVGVVVHMNRSYMYRNLVALLSEGVITIDDLSEFSEELRKRLEIITKD